MKSRDWRRFAGLLLFAGLMAGAAGVGRASSLTVHGLFEAGPSQRGAGFESNHYTMGDSPFDPWGVRLFGEAAISEKFQGFGQLVLHDPSSPYVESAYLSFKPSASRDMQIMAGKIPWPIGSYTPRSYSDKNPLIGSPMLYQYHTTLLWWKAPASADALLAVAGKGQKGETYGGGGTQGMPVVDNGYWDTGIALTGSARPLEYSLGLTTGTPGWGNVGEDENKSKTVLGRLGFQPVPAVRAGISGAYGAYLIEGLNATLPAGKTANSYHQRIAMADAALTFGHVELNGEAYANTWETPHTGDLHVHGGYAEAKVTVIPGVWLAGRGEVMRFSTVADSMGARHPWDGDRNRIELGVGYRPERDVRIKGVWQRNVEVETEENENYDLWALQVSVSF